MCLQSFLPKRPYYVLKNRKIEYDRKEPALKKELKLKYFPDQEILSRIRAASKHLQKHVDPKANTVSLDKSWKVNYYLDKAFEGDAMKYSYITAPVFNKHDGIRFRTFMKKRHYKGAYETYITASNPWEEHKWQNPWF